MTLTLHLTDAEYVALRAAVDRENTEVSTGDSRIVSLEEWAIDQLRRRVGLDDRAP